MPRRSIYGLMRKNSQVVRIRVPQDVAEVLAPLPAEHRNLLLRTVMRGLIRADASTLKEAQIVGERLMEDLAHLQATGELPAGSDWNPMPDEQAP